VPFRHAPSTAIAKRPAASQGTDAFKSERG
jgi:hypothetical protein